MPCSFAPIIDGNTRILVIGTMPGAVSLERQEYYAHERNLFWKVVSETFCGGRPFASYEEKRPAWRAIISVCGTAYNPVIASEAWTAPSKMRFRMILLPC